MKKKVKKYAEGGLSGIADTGTSLMNEVDGMAKPVNYGNFTDTVPTEPLGFSAVARMKKGGIVKSASARADGCAQRGKTRA